MTSEPDRVRLLQLARDAIVSHVGRLPSPAPAATGFLAVKSGAFVTLHRARQLRGCIGHLGVDEPLATVIPRCAVAACSQDPRFPAVEPAEIPELEIELSLLGPLEAIAGPAEIVTGRHGLVVEWEWRRGLLLPQVATEWNWDRETFLAQTCHKAGLPLDAWKRGAKIWRFEAEVFGESRGS